MNLLSLNDWTPEQIEDILSSAKDIKTHPEDYRDSMKQKTLLMIFEKPSLRTRVSFEVGMTQMGGHAIFYNVKDSPLGKKETIADTAMTASRFVDIIMARLNDFKDTQELALQSTVPVIDALSDMHHPCQIIADLLTMQEKKGDLMGLKICFLGEAFTNVPTSLFHGAALMGMHIAVGCPHHQSFQPKPEVVAETLAIAEKTGATFEIFHDARKAIENADIVYTDSWMSYHIPTDETEARMKILMPFQVNASIMELAKKNAIFMHDLPASRGMEVTADVIDGKQSIVFDQAENRLHAQKAIMLYLLKAR